MISLHYSLVLWCIYNNNFDVYLLLNPVNVTLPDSEHLSPPSGLKGNLFLLFSYYFCSPTVLWCFDVNFFRNSSLDEYSVVAVTKCGNVGGFESMDRSLTVSSRGADAVNSVSSQRPDGRGPDRPAQVQRH